MLSRQSSRSSSPEHKGRPVALAVVDLDGTLLEGPLSSEKLFFRFLLEQRLIGSRQVSAYCYFFLRWFGTFGLLTPKKNKAYLAGLRVGTIERAAEEFVKSRLMDRCCPVMRQRISSHPEQGYVTVLLTGSLEMIARPLCTELGILHMGATRCAVENGVFTGKPPLVHPFGREKVRLSREIGAQLGHDLGNGTAYGNDIHDLALLEAVARPVAVHPDKKLRRHAMARSWEIIEHAD